MDAALLLQAIAGHDPRDPASSQRPVPDYSAQIQAGPRGLRLGWPRDFFFERVQPEVVAAVEEATQVLVRAGAQLEEVPFGEAAYAVASGMAILFAEASAYHEEWLRTRPHDYGAPVRGRLRVGSTVLATDYIKAQQARTLLIQRVEAIFDRVDALIMPTVPVVAPGQDTAQVRWPDGTVEDMRGATLRLTRPFNLLGFPALSLPCGFSVEGLPIGLQLVARPFDEATVLRLAYAYERETEWHRRRPPLAALSSAAADDQQTRG
jgi:aspartyl-tRNA(Asn)/glutamyl-tRNA(Gln) amidotransferase subunit A